MTELGENMDIVEKLRKYKRDRSGYAEYCHRAADEIERLRKIEAAAVAAVEYEQWTGGTWYGLMIDLQEALRGEEERET